MGDGPVVATREGMLRGLDLGGVLAFLGIPYAAAPEDAEFARFGPPVPPRTWRGTRDATSPGPIAAQAPTGPGSLLPGDPLEQAEECRNLNIWTSGCDSARRPVLVFIHGGGFLGGSGASTLYRGDRLARHGVVVVTLNYRLGALGFLAHPELAYPGLAGCGNFGLADQLAALRYVRSQIAAFGGDPENVTIFGESAGGMSVCDLLAMPAARGLFRRAIVESGVALAHRLDLAERLAEDLARHLGLGRPRRDRLAQVPLAELLAAQQELVRAFDEGVGVPFAPVVDGGLLERHPADLLAVGAGSRRADLLVGTNHDEFAFFSFLSGHANHVDDAGVEALVKRYLEAAGLAKTPPAREVVALYRESLETGASPKAVLDAFGTDWIFRLPLLRMVEAHAAHGGATYCYRFDWRSPFGDGSLGACHALELPFVFARLDEPVVGLFAGSGAAAERLSEAIQQAWCAFARTGDPSSPVLGPWPRYVAEDRATMILDARPRVERAPGERTRQFFDPYFGRYGVGGPYEGARARSLAFLGETEDPGPEVGGGSPSAGT